MSIVDQDGHRLALAPSSYRVSDLAQYLQQVGTRSQVGYERREGPEGYSRRSVRSRSPERDEASGGREIQALGCQPGLSHTCRSGQQDRTAAGVQQRAHVLQLRHSSDERPLDVRETRFHPWIVAQWWPQSRTYGRTKSQTALSADGYNVSIQLRSRCAPASPDFSGWNCVAHSGPFSTAATKGSPCSAHVTSGGVSGPELSSSQRRAA